MCSKLPVEHTLATYSHKTLTVPAAGAKRGSELSDDAHHSRHLPDDCKQQHCRVSTLLGHTQASCKTLAMCGRKSPHTRAWSSLIQSHTLLSHHSHTSKDMRHASLPRQELLAVHRKVCRPSALYLLLLLLGCCCGCCCFRCLLVLPHHVYKQLVPAQQRTAQHTRHSTVTQSTAHRCTTESWVKTT